MKIYFDTCSLQRPLDDKAQLRVALEAEAVLGALAICEQGNATLVSSEALVLETERNPHSQRKAFVAGVLENAGEVILIGDEIETRAKSLEKRGFRAFDALHVACAEFAKVDYFCTCDDRLLKKTRRQTDIAIKVVSPLDLARELSA